jgi:ABC-type lipoprotein release transport system permease subunit
MLLPSLKATKKRTVHLGRSPKIMSVDADRYQVAQLAIGVVIGLAGALAPTRILKSVLVQVSPADPATLVTATLVLSAAAALGCVIPARRAMRVDPIVALYRE